MSSKQIRNLERRRERSRYAARSRRGREAEIFAEVSESIPAIPNQTVTSVDRIAVLRLATSYCRLLNIIPKLLPEAAMSEFGNEEEVVEKGLWSEESLNETMTGFLLVLNSNGAIVYISNGVSNALGLTQADLIGQHLSDYMNEDDYAELMRCDRDSEVEGTHHMILRMKTVLTPRGRSLNLRSAINKAIDFAVKTVFEPSGDKIWLLHGEPIQQSAMTATQLQVWSHNMSTGSFMSRHSMDMKFTYCHEKATSYLGYQTKKLIDTSFFNLVHPEDLSQLTASLKQLYKKGQCRTEYYRMITENGDYIWTQTEATTIVQSSGGQKTQYIACNHQVLGTFRPQTKKVDDKIQIAAKPSNGWKRTRTTTMALRPKNYNEIANRKRGCGLSKSDNPKKLQRLDPETNNELSAIQEIAVRFDAGDVPSPGTIKAWLLDDYSLPPESANGRIEPISLQLAGLAPASPTGHTAVSLASGLNAPDLSRYRRDPIEAIDSKSDEPTLVELQDKEGKYWDNYWNDYWDSQFVPTKGENSGSRTTQIVPDLSPKPISNGIMSEWTESAMYPSVPTPNLSINSNNDLLLNDPMTITYPNGLVDWLSQPDFGANSNVGLLQTEGEFVAPFFPESDMLPLGSENEIPLTLDDSQLNLADFSDDCRAKPAFSTSSNNMNVSDKEISEKLQQTSLANRQGMNFAVPSGFSIPIMTDNICCW